MRGPKIMSGSPSPKRRSDAGSPALSAKLLDAAAKRKQAEHDRQLLLNRIALLKKEEARAWKKIQKTKGRAEEILRIRLEHEQETKARQELALVEVRRRKMEADKHAAIEEEMRRARAAQVAAVHDRKKVEVAKVRDEAAQWREEIRAKRLEDIVTKQQRRLEIKAREDELREKREAERKKIMEQNRRAYEEKILAQEKESEAKEKEVLKMERVEMRLIQQLKKTQVMQQHAFEDLEQALNGDLSSQKKRAAASAGKKRHKAPNSAMSPSSSAGDLEAKGD